MRSRRLKSKGEVDGQRDGNGGEDAEDEEDAQRKRDLVEELIGEEKDDEHTHTPEGTYEVLNEVVVDRGPSASEFHVPCPSIPFLDPMLTHPSNVFHRGLRRRRALHIHPSRRRLCVHAHRINGLQPRSRRFLMPPRKPHNASNSHMRTYPLLQAYHPPRHDSPAHRSPLRREDQLMGEFRRTRTYRVETRGLCDHQRESISFCCGPGTW